MWPLNFKEFWKLWNWPFSNCVFLLQKRKIQDYYKPPAKPMKIYVLFTMKVTKLLSHVVERCLWTFLWCWHIYCKKRQWGLLSFPWCWELKAIWSQSLLAWQPMEMVKCLAQQPLGARPFIFGTFYMKKMWYYGYFQDKTHGTLLQY